MPFLTKFVAKSRTCKMVVVIIATLKLATAMVASAALAMVRRLELVREQADNTRVRGRVSWMKEGAEPVSF